MIKMGDIVFYNDPGSAFGKGDTVCPAIVTQVHSEDCVNLTLFSDEGPRTISSAVLDPNSSGVITVGNWRKGPFLE